MAIPGYRILRKIRQGGMSTVYLATQKSVGREVALKVMSPTLSSDPSFGSRFYREAKIVGQLSHPNIVSIYDVGSYKHYNYIAMDYLPGIPLQERLEQGVSPEEALRITREMASALDYAHERGYIHRDIKPDNILFRSDGSSVLCDFGIAKARKTSMKVTNVGSVLGTPHYMSPEQAQGKSVDGRSDLYGLGVVLFEILTGHVPYQGEEPVAVAVKHISAPIPALPSNLRIFQPLINKLLAKKPANRYQTGKELIADIDALESKMNAKSPAYLTQTNATAIQVIGLLGALLNTLGTAIFAGFGKLLLNKKKLSANTIQLSKQQLEAIDSFVLDDDNIQTKENLSSKTLESDEPAGATKSWVKLAGLIGLIVAITVISLQIYQQSIPAVLAKESQTKIANIIAAKENVSNAAPVVLPIKREPQTLAKKVQYSLNINTSPQQAKVRILNIKPAYQPSMMLNPGKYHIEVSATDYHTKKLWINIKNLPVTEQITLDPTRKLFAPGTIIIETLSDQAPGPEMIILPEVAPGATPIAIGRNEVTFSEYDKFAIATGRERPDDEGWGRENRPAINLSHDDGLAYALWLSQETGSTYRLPTQLEWQHAARAGGSTDFWWGEESAEGKANCRSGCDSEWSKLFSSLTAPVASYSANKYGLHDTAGNVREWLSECKNRHDEQQTGCSTALAAGGSHSDKLSKTTSNSFHEMDAGKAYKNTGFRLVLEL